MNFQYLIDDRSILKKSELSESIKIASAVWIQLPLDNLASTVSMIFFLFRSTSTAFNNGEQIGKVRRVVLIRRHRYITTYIFCLDDKKSLQRDGCESSLVICGG
jgi:hypothetical protein